MSLGDKASPLKLIEREMVAVPIETDALDGPIPIEILARVAARMFDPLRNDSRFEKLAASPAPNDTQR